MPEDFLHVVRRGRRNHKTEAPRYLEPHGTFGEPSVQEGHCSWTTSSHYAAEVNSSYQEGRPGGRYHTPEALRFLDTKQTSEETFVREEAFYLERILSGEM